MKPASMFARRLACLGALAAMAIIISGCASQKFTRLRYDPWTQSPPEASPPQFHLLLVVEEESKSGQLLADGDLLAEEIAAAYLKGGRGRMVSYQVLEQTEDADAWALSFRPQAPVLKVLAKYAVSVTNANWTAMIEARSKYQAGFYGTGAEARSAAQVYKVLSVSDRSDGASVRKWAKQDGPKLYRAFAAKLAAAQPLKRSETELPYYVGKSERHAQARSAAEAGDVAKAIALWETEAEQNPEDRRVCENLSAAYEAQGNLQKALEWNGRAAERSAKGLKGLGASVLKEREDALRGMLRLSTEPFNEARNPKPGMKLAVFPLENETNDLDAPVKLRNALAERAAKLGAELIPLSAVDEKLKASGFTDAGQLRAAGGAQKLGAMVGADFLLMGNVEEFQTLPARRVKASLKLIHASDGDVLYEKTLKAQEEPKNFLNSIIEKVLEKTAELVVEKATGKTLLEETSAVADRFMRAIPHFRP